MIQNQLVDYIGAQFKAGVPRETVRAALIGVGWQVIDIDDTLKKVEEDAVAMPSASVQASPMSSAASASPVSVQAKSLPLTPAGSPAGISVGSSAGVKTMGPFGGVSPLVTRPVGSLTGSGMGSPAMSRPASSAGSFSPMDVMGGVAPGAKPVTSPIGQSTRPLIDTSKSNPFGANTGAAKVDAFASGTRFNNTGSSVSASSAFPVVTHTGERVSMVAEAVGLVALAALSIFFYTQNSTLTAKVNALTAAGGGVTTQASDLTGQVQTLTASNSALTVQVSGMMTQINDLKTQLGFFAFPQGGASTSSVLAGTVSGIVSAPLTARAAYSIRTPYDVVIFIKNSGDPKVVAMVKPLVGATAILAGSYVVGSDAITITSVNGILVNPLVVVATSTTATTTTTTATVTTVTTTTVSNK